MVTMAQNAVNWRNTHTDRLHSLTHLHQHSHNHVVQSASSAISITEIGIHFLFWRYLIEGEQAEIPRENPQQPAH